MGLISFFAYRHSVFTLPFVEDVFSPPVYMFDIIVKINGWSYAYTCVFYFVLFDNNSGFVWVPYCFYYISVVCVLVWYSKPYSVVVLQGIFESIWTSMVLCEFYHNLFLFLWKKEWEVLQELNWIWKYHWINFHKYNINSTNLCFFSIMFLPLYSKGQHCSL